MPVPTSRLTRCNTREVNPAGSYVLYWMTAGRRPFYNFALQRAVEQARAWHKGLLILEVLRCTYPFASDRLHAFAVEGMADNAAYFSRTRARYYPYLEPMPDASKGLLRALASRACVLVTDDCPWLADPYRTEHVAGEVSVAIERVDSVGLLPMAACERVFPSAHTFRRVLQEHLPEHLESLPVAAPLDGVSLAPPPSLPAEVTQRWPLADVARVAADRARLAAFPIDHTVSACALRGGFGAARSTLKRFLDTRLARYEAGRNHPDDEATSGLSPFLHFGHIGAHEVFVELARHEGWTSARLAHRHDGARAGWWGMTPSAEAFLDELVTWRELAINFAAKRADTKDYSSLPTWARKTLEAHACDPRPWSYTTELATAATPDEVWNAAQRELLSEGRIHSYLRMLWGKKILEWSPSPQAAVTTMIELNDRYALDGQDPNSYSGIMWCLGRYDRPWAPERSVFGTVRFMSSRATTRKLRIKEYLHRFAKEG